MYKTYKAFISYRRKTGSEIARSIYEGLKSRRLKAFLDVDRLKAGPYPKALIENVKDSYTLLAVICPGDLNDRGRKDDYYIGEISCAMTENICVIPILAKGFTFDDDVNIPSFLKSLNKIESLTYDHIKFKYFIGDVASFVRFEYKRYLKSSETRNADKGRGSLSGIDKDYDKHTIDINRNVSDYCQVAPAKKVEIWKWRFDNLAWHKQRNIIKEFSIDKDISGSVFDDAFDKLLSTIKTQSEFERFIKAIADNEK